MYLTHLIYTVRPCLIHTCHAMPMLCSDHAVLLKAMAQYVRREMACGLSVCFRLLPATTWSSTKVVIRRIPVSCAGGQRDTKHRLSWTRKRVVAAHYKKGDLLHCQTSSSENSGYRTNIHCRSRVGARHGMCELTHGMAGERHGHGMLCVNRPQDVGKSQQTGVGSTDTDWMILRNRIYISSRTF